MRGAPFVLTSHVLPTKTFDFGAGEVIRILSNPWVEAVTRRALLHYFTDCDAVVALNDPAAADIVKFGYAGRLIMIPNGRDVSRFGACGIADIASQRKVLTFVGMVNRRKNQRFLIEVLNCLPDNYVLQIVGERLDPAYASKLEELVREGSNRNVVFTGPVPYGAIPGYLEDTHVFVSASMLEVQSLVIVEALASGTPVVGLSNETVDELVDDTVGCRLPSDTSPEEFARRVREICTLSPSAYQELCLNARERVAPLDWPRVRAMTIEAYETLLREHTASETRFAQARRIIALVPSGEAQDVLEERLVQLERVAQRRQVRPSTWLWLGLVRAISSVIQFVLGPVRRLRRKMRGAEA
jgi:glycosyltransferase involved in cell wall biosynthesis